MFQWLAPSGDAVELEHVPLDEVEKWLCDVRWAYDEIFAFAVDRLLFDVVKKFMDHAARAMPSNLLCIT